MVAMPVMLDTVVPEVATLVVVTPAFVGVAVALLAAMALAIRATLRELEHPAGAVHAASRAAGRPASPLAA